MTEHDWRDSVQPDGDRPRRVWRCEHCGWTVASTSRPSASGGIITAAVAGQGIPTGILEDCDEERIRQVTES